MRTAIFTVLSVLLLLTACSAPQTPPSQAEEAPSAPAETVEPTQEVEAPAEEPPAPRRVEEAEEEPAEPTAPIPLYGAVPILPTEDTKPVQIKSYELDKTENTATLKLVRFTIRNNGDAPIRPRIIMQLSGDGFNTNKIWDYDRLLDGYKFEKEAAVSIELDAPKLMKVMKLSVLDMDNGMVELGSDTRQFIPITK
jgi:hypothetical protein